MSIQICFLLFCESIPKGNKSCSDLKLLKQILIKIKIITKKCATTSTSDSRKIFGPSNRALNAKKQQAAQGHINHQSHHQHHHHHQHQHHYQQQQQEAYEESNLPMKVSTSFDNNSYCFNPMSPPQNGGGAAGNSGEFESTSTSTTAANQYKTSNQYGSNNHQHSSSSNNKYSNHYSSSSQQHTYSRNLHDKTLSIVGSILDVPLPSENDAFSEYSTFVNNIFSK